MFCVDNILAARFHMVAAKQLLCTFTESTHFYGSRKIMAARFYVVAARTLTVNLQLEPIFMAVEKILAARFYCMWWQPEHLLCIYS
jgi:hypothetical protein